MSSTQYVDVSRTLQRLASADTHPDNVAAIREYVDHCAAEGISEVQQDRQVQSFKAILEKFAPKDFRLRKASEGELKTILAGMNRSDYAESSKHKMKCTIKKFYKVENGGEHPEKVKFFDATQKKVSTVTREDIFTQEELKRLFRGFNSTRDRAFTMALYESAARPGEMLSRNLADFTANEKGDFIYLEGIKHMPDRTNQLVRAGRPIREWIAQHPLGGGVGDIEDPSAPLWVKREQQACLNCGEIPHHHDDSCEYEPDLADRVRYDGFLRRFKQTCERADIPKNKRRPYNLRHTRLTEVATFMGYEQLNKFAGWKPGSNRAKVYVHLNNEDVNKAIREQYGLEQDVEEPEKQPCPFCDTVNQPEVSECRRCGRPLSLRQQVKEEEKRSIVERLAELEENGVLEKLEQLDEL